MQRERGCLVVGAAARRAYIILRSTMLLLPALRGALYRTKRGVPKAALVSCLFFGGLGRVVALCPEAPPQIRTVPDADRMCPLPPSDSTTIQPEGCASSEFPIIDTHTHAWENCYKFSDTDQDLSACPPSPGKKARYIPAGVLPFPKLEEKWCSNSISYGVLVQPSFLGVNNSYLVRQLRDRPWLRGVIVVTNADGTLDYDAVSPPLLEDMHKAGVRGIRLNLLKKSEEEMARINAAMDAETGEDGFVNLWAFIKDHGWHIEAQQESDGWVGLIDTLVGKRKEFVFWSHVATGLGSFVRLVFENISAEPRLRRRDM